MASTLANHLNSSCLGNRATNERKMTIPELLQMKRDGLELTPSQIEFLVEAITTGAMEDSQLGAFLMSVYLKGMTHEETAVLTRCMKNSGKVLSWPDSWKVVDKHSTGGVGDKVSLPLAPALAALGLKVPMISGRGLGHTGGTLDKLESIPGYNMRLSEEEMWHCLDSVGCFIVGQTKTLVPADGRMYSLRDVTSTVSSIPLIVSSIISKKASEGLNSLVLDVKYGSGSFAGPLPRAEALARALVDAGNAMGMHSTAFVTSMDSPIGRKIGNALEVEESLDCLRGKGPSDLRFLVAQLGGELLCSSGIVSAVKEGVKLIENVLDDGSAMDKFREMLQFQGVSKEVAEDLCGADAKYECLPKSKTTTKVLSHKNGRIVGIDALDIAMLTLLLGGGRMNSADPINYGVGVNLLKTVGDEVTEKEPWLEIHHDDPLDEGQLYFAEKAVNIGPIKDPWTNTNLIARKFCI